MCQSSMTTLQENLEKLEDAIASACRSAGRTRSEVELMAVSKTYPASTISEAAGLGLTLFGENRVQEFAAKAVDLAALRSAGSVAAPEACIRVHLIGHLQSNKAARAEELFDAIDSIDSLRLAERLNDCACRSVQAPPHSPRSQAQPGRNQIRPRSQLRRSCANPRSPPRASNT